jgi:hypothetical protein
MTEIHATISRMIILYALIVGLWGLVNFFRRQAPTGNFNGALILGEGLFVLQGVIGVILLLLGKVPQQGLHFLYGVMVAITLPGVYAYVRDRNTARESLLFGLAMLFIFGLALRAVTTAGS